MGKEIRYPFDVESAFYVFDGDEQKKQLKDKSFCNWLKNEGFKEVFISEDASRLYGAYYIDIKSMQYTQAYMDIILAPIVGNQGIFIEDFKAIYAIFKRQKSLDADNYHDVSKLRTVDDYKEEKRIRNIIWEARKWAYFDHYPTYEEWCDDVANAIMKEDWYKDHCTKEEILKDMEDKLIARDLRNDFEEKTLPCEVAGKWWMITF